MNRINQCLSQLRSENRKALVTYIVSGDPVNEATLPAMHKLVESGADIIELGVPFSDPMAEGPVIQKGHERALANGASLQGTLNTVAEFRKMNSTTPIVLMGYANPVERMGHDTFVEKALQAGVDGLLTVDLPPEENAEFNSKLQTAGIETISLIAPTTTNERIDKIASQSSGFLYYVSLKGVTGASNLDSGSVNSKLADIRQYTSLPVLVGFGIKDAESALVVGKESDGVIVGSAIVNAMAQGQEQGVEEICHAIADVVSPIREALNTITK